MVLFNQVFVIFQNLNHIELFIFVFFFLSWTLIIFFLVTLNFLFGFDIKLFDHISNFIIQLCFFHYGFTFFFLVFVLATIIFWHYVQKILNIAHNEVDYVSESEEKPLNNVVNCLRFILNAAVYIYKGHDVNQWALNEFLNYE